MEYWSIITWMNGCLTIILYHTFSPDHIYEKLEILVVKNERAIFLQKQDNLYSIFKNCPLILFQILFFK
jgi:hypothetical protein